MQDITTIMTMVVMDSEVDLDTAKAAKLVLQENTNPGRVIFFAILACLVSISLVPV